MRRVLFATVLVVAAALFVPAGLAHEEEQGEESEDEEWEQDHREVRVEAEEGHFKYESQRSSALARDRIEVEFELEDAELRYRFETTDNGSQRRIDLRLEDWVLFEFVDADVNGAHGLGEAVVRRFVPHELEDGDLSETSTGNLRRIDATYPLPGGGRWTLRFVMGTQPVQIDGYGFGPTEIKFDIEIQGYPYAEPRSRLAVQVALRTQTVTEAGSKGDAAALFAGQGEFRGFLRWVNTSTVDGAAAPVLVDVREDAFSDDDHELQRRSLVTFHYARGASIVHDPSLGVVRVVAAGFGPVPVPVQALGDWRIILGGAFVGAALVAFTLLPRIRVRK